MMLDGLKRYKHLLFIIILFVFYNSLFINKAFHIDDVYVILVARVAASKPFEAPQFFTRNPILMGYYYAPIIRIFGEKEPWLHFFYFPFSLLAIVSMFFLSRRFAKKSLLPVLFLIATPAFILSSQSIMFDIPLLGFLLAAVTTFIYGLDRNNNRLLILSGLFAALAILTKYSGFVLLPILFIYALIHSKVAKAKFLLIPLLVFVLWNIYCILVYRHAVFFSALLYNLKHYFLSGIWIRTLASLSFLSGTSIIVLLLSPFLFKKRNGFFCIFLALASGLFPFLLKGIFGEYSLLEKSFLAVLFIASSYVILLFFRSGARSFFNKGNKDTLFLSAWFFLALAFNLLTNFIAARFSLLLLPPLVLFIYNRLPVDNFKSIKPKLGLIILSSAIFSTLLAIGDYQFAGIYRDFASSFKETTLSKEKEEPYFYHGHYYDSWGYAYYLERFYPSPATAYEIKQRLSQPGGILITPSEPVLPIVGRKSSFIESLEADYDRILIDSISYKGNIILHNRKFRSGFYSHGWGLLPFYLSMRRVTLENFKIYRLSKRYEH